MIQAGDMVLSGLGDWYMLIPKECMIIYNCLINPDYFFQKFDKDWQTPRDADGSRLGKGRAVSFRGELKNETERLLQSMHWEYRNRAKQYMDVVTGLLKIILIHFRSVLETDLNCRPEAADRMENSAALAEDMIRIAPKIFQLPPDISENPPQT